MGRLDSHRERIEFIFDTIYPTINSNPRVWDESQLMHLNSGKKMVEVSLSLLEKKLSGKEGSCDYSGAIHALESVRGGFRQFTSFLRTPVSRGEIDLLHPQVPEGAQILTQEFADMAHNEYIQIIESVANMMANDCKCLPYKRVEHDPWTGHRIVREGGHAYPVDDNGNKVSWNDGLLTDDEVYRSMQYPPKKE